MIAAEPGFGATHLSLIRFKVENTTLHSMSMFTYERWELVQGFRLGSVRIKGDVPNRISFDRYTHPQPLD